MKYYELNNPKKKKTTSLSLSTALQKKKIFWWGVFSILVACSGDEEVKKPL